MIRAPPSAAPCDTRKHLDTFWIVAPEGGGRSASSMEREARDASKHITAPPPQITQPHVPHARLRVCPGGRDSGCFGEDLHFDLRGGGQLLRMLGAGVQH